MHNPLHQFFFGLGAGVTGEFLDKVWPGAPTALYWLLVSFGVGLMLWAAFSAARERGWSPSTLVASRKSFIPLADAAREAYETTRWADKYLHADGQGRLEYHAIDIFLDATDQSRQYHKLFGNRPPSRTMEEIPSEGLRWTQVSSDLKRVAQVNRPETVEWDNLSVTRRALNAHIKRQNAGKTNEAQTHPKKSDA